MMQLLHTSGLKGYCTYQHSIQTDTCAPYIHFETFISLIFQYFRGYICGSTTLLGHSLLICLHLSWDTEISNFYSSSGIQKNIVKLDVSMHNQFWVMQICKTFYQLFKEIFGNFFGELPSLSHISQQVKTSTQFHHEAYVLVSLECIIQSDHALMIALFQYSELLHYLLFFWMLYISSRYVIAHLSYWNFFAPVFLASQELLINRFYRD